VIVLVAAMGRNRVIGVDGGLPWHLADDLKRFKALTVGKPIIMGRNTFNSIGRALPARTNIVITRNTEFTAEGVVVVSTPGEALVRALREVDDGGSEICIVGGGQIYRQFLPLASRIELTVVDAAPDGDTTFPDLDDTWGVVTEEFLVGEPSLRYLTLEPRSQELEAS
jgi:dihydrofolate reductase